MSEAGEEGRKQGKVGFCSIVVFIGTTFKKKQPHWKFGPYIVFIVSLNLKQPFYKF